MTRIESNDGKFLLYADGKKGICYKRPENIYFVLNRWMLTTKLWTSEWLDEKDVILRYKADKRFRVTILFKTYLNKLK